ncbi:hypothetical protein Nepgr_008654 [Nepenthes gracilis]|uniref:TPX2 C-terminal domain-containing protein n=1 Tax=Nepenthes gracilis TaxID=150966 RepID=A0AAD3S9D5_NEPGR|nr:hypothetical protein Nepgr_008654 [Nepenthes gracilis]
MGEPTCVVHALSCTSSISNYTQEQENFMCALGESVSLGRFMPESLAWEKWSTFSRNRYVEEAEKYSQPGSVAQKKAYFEAHFKRMAALKAAALLEQANAGQDASQALVEGKVLNCTAHDYDAQQMSLFPKDEVMDQQWTQKEGVCGDFLVDHNEVGAVSGKDESTITNVEDPNPGAEIQSGEQNVDVENSFGRTKMAESSLTKIEKPPLQKSDVDQVISMKIRKKNPPLSSYLSSVGSSAPQISCSPVKSVAAIHPGKENYATPIGKKSLVEDNPGKKRTPLRMSINRELNKLISPVIKKFGGSSMATTPIKTHAKDSEDGVPNSPPVIPKSPKGGMKSPRTSMNKTSSPIIPNSFCLRSSERTVRRKEKLEEKFNANVTQKVKQQSTFKEKAEAELTKLRGGFCFKMQPLPGYYDQTENAKILLQKPPKQGRKASSSSTFKSTNCLPPRNQRPASRGGSKDGQQKI